MRRREERSREDRVVTVPNAITVARLLLLPVVVFILLNTQDFILATAILMFIGATDFLDGYVARRFNQVSELGRIIDPSADRIVIVVISALCLYMGWIPLDLGALILIRESIVTAISIYLFKVRGVRLDVIWLGKFGTLLLLVSLPIILLGESRSPNFSVLHTGGLLVALVGIFILYGAVVQYLRFTLLPRRQKS